MEVSNKGFIQTNFCFFFLRCKMVTNGITKSTNHVLAGSWCRKCFDIEKAGKHLILKDGRLKQFK
jgi:hypothetical protein